MPANTNWRILDFFGVPKLHNICSKSGQDSSLTGDENDPFRTLTKGFNEVSLNTSIVFIQVREGYYSGGDFVNQNGQIAFGLDGSGVIDNGTFATLILSSGNQRDSINFICNESFWELRNVTSSNTDIALIGFICKNVNNITLDTNRTFAANKRVLFIDSSNITIKSSDSIRLFYRFTWINTNSIIALSSIQTRMPILSNHYYDDNSNITFSGSSGSAVLSFQNCIFKQGHEIDSNNTQTLLGNPVLNTPISISVSVSGVAIQFVNCQITSDPKFNNETIEDYSLRGIPDQSPLFNNKNIVGCMDVGYTIYSTHPAFDPSNPNVIYNNITRNIGDGSWSLTTSGVGFFISTNDPNICIDFGEPITLNKFIQFLGLEPANNEMADEINYNAISAPNNVRWDYRFQGYNESEPNGSGSLSNWLPSQTTWYINEINAPIQIDASGKGSGNVDVDWSSVDSPTFQRWRVYVTLRDDSVV